MKKLALLIAISSIVSLSFATNVNDKKESKKQTTTVTQNIISGQIVDENTGEALAGVKVTLVGTTQEVYTDFDGNFVFKGIGAEKHSIKTNLISYKTSVHNNVNNNGLNIKLSAL